MAVRDQIDRIIANRKEKSASLQKRKDHMQDLKNQLKSFSSALVMQTRDIKDEQLRAQYGAVFGGVNTMPVQKKVDQMLRKLDEGIKRFERDYISIATVGKGVRARVSFCNLWVTWTTASFLPMMLPLALGPPLLYGMISLCPGAQ